MARQSRSYNCPGCNNEYSTLDHPHLCKNVRAHESKLANMQARLWKQSETIKQLRRKKQQMKVRFLRALKSMKPWLPSAHAADQLRAHFDNAMDEAK